MPNQAVYHDAVVGGQSRSLGEERENIFPCPLGAGRSPWKCINSLEPT